MVKNKYTAIDKAIAGHKIKSKKIIVFDIEARPIANTEEDLRVGHFMIYSCRVCNNQNLGYRRFTCSEVCHQRYIQR